MWPDKRRDELPIMPKGRYAIMLRHMPAVGSLGLDMMLRTCTIQVNLDYCSEANMAKKFRVGLALQPLATALFANSPFTEGKPNGMLSYRSHIWSDTDPHRTGMLPFVFEDGFGYERYVDYMLDVPMYFVFRDGRYIDAAGQSFRDFMAGKLPRCLASCRRERLDRPPLDGVPRSAAQIVPRDARCRRRPMEPHLRATRAVGRPALRRRRARRGMGPGQALVDGRARGAACAVPKLALDAPLPGGAGCSTSRAKSCRSPAAASSRVPGSTRPATARRASSSRSRRSSAAARSPRSALLDKFHGEWGGDIARVYEESF
jgi:glutamate--cysteine ligase